MWCGSGRTHGASCAEGVAMRNFAHAQVILWDQRIVSAHMRLYAARICCCYTTASGSVLSSRHETAKRPGQLNLVDVWSVTSKKRVATERDPELNNSAETETEMEGESAFHTPEEQVASGSSSLPSTSSEWSAETSSESHIDSGSEVVSSCNTFIVLLI